MRGHSQSTYQHPFLDDVVYENCQTPDGMQIFKAWGPHIKQFAMSFEVDEGKN